MHRSAVERPRGTSIGVVGTGAVGHAVATALTVSALADEVVVASRTETSAVALATDLADMASALGHATRVRAAGPHTLAARCAAVVITLRATFTNTAPGADARLGGLGANAPAIRDVARLFTGYPGTVLIVTNPVDVMTRLFAETSGALRVWGVGSNLDSARYRLLLAEHHRLAVTSVQGHVVGEHGKDMVPLVSSARAHGAPLPVPSEVVEATRTRASAITAHGGRTRCGPAGAVVSALAKALGRTDGLEELSAPHLGVHMGTVLEFTAGHAHPAPLPLSPAENTALHAAADKLREVYAQLPPDTGGP